MTCKDCLHYEACRAYYNEKFLQEYVDAVGCATYADKAEWVHLPCKALPLLKDSNPCNTDVYCPSCGENLSGYYTESLLDIVVCFNCGEMLDITKAATREEAEKALAERRKDDVNIH